MRLLNAELPTKKLGVSHYCDLLTYPFAAVRKAALQKLLQEYYHVADRATLQALSTVEKKLSREQVLLLLEALREKDQKQYALFY